MRIFALLFTWCALALGSAWFYLPNNVTFTPGDLSGLTLWLDADNAGSITQAGGKVSQWDDLSTTAASFVQGTGTLQPAYVASAIGGKPALSFSGSTSGNSFLVDTGTNQFIGDGTQPFTVWMVAQAGTSAAFVVFADFHGTGATNNPEMGFASADPSYRYLYFAANSGQPFERARSETSYSDPNTAYIFGITYDGAGTYNFYDSNVSQTVVASANASGNTANTSIGGYAAGGGIDAMLYLSEMVVVNRVLNSTELGQLQTYGASKFGF